MTESSGSFESVLMSGVASVTRNAGKTIEHIPLISRTQIDETLISAGYNLKNAKINKTIEMLKKLADKQSSSVTPFEDSIRAIERVYNNDLEIYFDSENVYVGTDRPLA